MWRAHVRLNLETWRRWWCTVELHAWGGIANITISGTDTESGIDMLGMVRWGAAEVPLRRESRLSIQ